MYATSAMRHGMFAIKGSGFRMDRENVPARNDRRRDFRSAGRRVQLISLEQIIIKSNAVCSRRSSSPRLIRSLDRYSDESFASEASRRSVSSLLLQASVAPRISVIRFSRVSRDYTNNHYCNRRWNVLSKSSEIKTSSPKSLGPSRIDLK